MICVIDPTGKGIVNDRSSPPLKPGTQGGPDLGRNLLLNDHRASANLFARDEGSDFDFNEIAVAELAVDGEIEQRTISHSPFSVQEEADRPNLALLQRFLDANLSTGIPCRSAQCSWIILCDTHLCSP